MDASLATLGSNTTYTGHRHHTHEFTKEFSGMTVTQHPTLAARDAYASRGLLAGRIFRPVVDVLFFFDKNHCKGQYEYELETYKHYKKI